MTLSVSFPVPFSGVFFKNHVVKKALLGFCLLFGWLSLAAQQPNWTGKRIGLYVSSAGFTFSEDYYQDIAQFLFIGENRAQEANVKAELMIRFGETLARELQRVSAADTVYFINGDMARGKSFVQSYDARTGLLKPLGAEFKDTDAVLIVQGVDMKMRMVNSTYIRSNEMKNERKAVRVGRMETLYALVADVNAVRRTSAKYDAYSSQKVANPFIFSAQPSELGTFLGQLCATWWESR